MLEAKEDNENLTKCLKTTPDCAFTCGNLAFARRVLSGFGNRESKDAR
jgi:hypothetical protein